VVGYRSERAGSESTPGNTCIVPDINGHPITGTTQKALRACAIAQANHGKAKGATLEAQVDGVQLQDLTAYEALSPEFTFTAIAGNPFGVPAGKSESVADGFWIMLKPLREGVHWIHFHAKVPFPELNFTFEITVTYKVTIADD
jgi:hypothetical protein